MSGQQTFGILGAGNVGVGLAVDLEHRGHKALLYATPDHDRIFRKIEKQGSIEATESLTGVYSPSIMRDLDSLINYTDVIVVAVPSTAHESVLTLFQRYKRELKHKTLIFITGNGVVPHACKELGLDNCFETARAPYTVRIEEHPNDLVKVRINGFKTRTIIAGMHAPSEHEQKHAATLFGMNVEWYDDVAQVLFVDNHGVLHAPTMLRNQDAIRRKEQIFFYRDGMNLAVCEEMLSADAEVEAIAKALGVPKRESLLGTLNGDYGTKHPNMITFVRKIEALNRRPALPGSMHARQITQDVQFLAVLWVSLARALGIDAPVLRSWIDESNEINNADYWTSGRTLAYYGLRPDASKEEILAAFNVKSSLAERRDSHEEDRSMGTKCMMPLTEA